MLTSHSLCLVTVIRAKAMQDRVNVCVHMCMHAWMLIDLFFCVAKIVCAQTHQGRRTVRELANGKNGKGVNIIVDLLFVVVIVGTGADLAQSLSYDRDKSKGNAGQSECVYTCVCMLGC